MVAASTDIKMSISKRLFNDVYFPHLLDYSHRWNILYGGAGSGKSVFIVQKLIIKAMKTKRRVLICRKTGNTLRQSVFQLVKDILVEFKIADQCRIVESMFLIELPNGSEFIFMGLDDEMKLLSIQDISDVFVEECTETSKEILEQLNLRMRGKAPQQQIHLAFNPVSTLNFMFDFTEVNPPSSVFKLKTTYRDNKFLSKEYVAGLEDLRRTNPRKAKIFCNGEWGTVGLLVFEDNWEIRDFEPIDKIKLGYTSRIGADFGFSLDPTTVISTLYDKAGETIWIYDEIYQRGLTNPDLAASLKDKGWHKQHIWFDSAEPKSIVELNRLGCHAKGASKGRDSIKYGIAFLQRHKIYVHPRCKNLINEFKDYQYLMDKQSGQYNMEKFCGSDHAIDGLRYAYSEYYNNAKFKLMSKTTFGI